MKKFFVLGMNPNMRKKLLERGELRWQTLGLVGGIVLLLVAHTVRSEQEDEVIRIISARKAVRKERQRYYQNRKKASLG